MAVPPRTQTTPSDHAERARALEDDALDTEIAHRTAGLENLRALAQGRVNNLLEARPYTQADWQDARAVLGVYVAEKQRRLARKELGDDPRLFAEQVQDPARDGPIKAQLGQWLEIGASELDAYIDGSPTAELEELVGHLDSARTSDREFQSFIYTLRQHVAGALDGSFPTQPSAARPEYRARLASTVRERLLEMGAIRRPPAQQELSGSEPADEPPAPSVQATATTAPSVDGSRQKHGGGAPRRLNDAGKRALVREMVVYRDRERQYGRLTYAQAREYVLEQHATVDPLAEPAAVKWLRQLNEKTVADLVREYPEWLIAHPGQR